MNNILINRLLKKIYKNIFRKIEPVLSSNKKEIEKKQEIQKLINSYEFRRYVSFNSKKLASHLIKYQGKETRELHNLAKKQGIKLENFYTFKNKIIKQLINENTKLITTIPAEILKLRKLKYVETIYNNVVAGSISRREFLRFLNNLGTKYAKIIARTETAKLQTKLVELRSDELGVKFYKWRAAHDRRTRPSHKRMDGVIVKWSKIQEQKPYLDGYYGNAGEFFNCRCSPLPIISEISLRNEKSNLKMYKNKKIININKRDFIKEFFNNQEQKPQK